MTTYSYVIEERQDRKSPWRSSESPIEVEESNLAIGPFATWKSLELQKAGLRFGPLRRIVVQQW